VFALIHNSLVRYLPEPEQFSVVSLHIPSKYQHLPSSGEETTSFDSFGRDAYISFPSSSNKSFPALSIPALSNSVAYVPVKTAPLPLPSIARIVMPVLSVILTLSLSAMLKIEERSRCQLLLLDSVEDTGNELWSLSKR